MPLERQARSLCNSTCSRQAAIKRQSGIGDCKSSIGQTGADDTAIGARESAYDNQFAYQRKNYIVWFPVMQKYGWLDTLVALHWLKGVGEYK